MSSPTSPSDVDDLLREFAPQAVGVLTRRFGDFEAAEDAVQEALIAAAAHWPVDGIPVGPRGWLIQTAERRLIDQWRNEGARRDREAAAALREPSPGEVDDHAATEQDDTLTVLFMCCHPALTPASAIALTLRAVGGLTTREIASAFMVDEPTMAQRISRAKQSIKRSGEPFLLPGPGEWEPRVRSVLHVLYLLFNEGYVSTSGSELRRDDLSDEAIRLARMAHGLLPGDGEVTGLLALMLLIDARRPARADRYGDPIPLPEQDRSLWNRARIAEGTELIDRAIAQGAVGEYQLQAAIAAVHDRAETAADTDWPQILALYGLLDTMTGNPVVTLNQAVALGMVEGPAAGLALVETVADRLDGSYRLDAVRAYLLELQGDRVSAREHYRAAAARTASLPERRYLTMQAARLNDGSPPA